MQVCVLCCINTHFVMVASDFVFWFFVGFFFSFQYAQTRFRFHIFVKFQTPLNRGSWIFLIFGRKNLKKSGAERRNEKWRTKKKNNYMGTTLYAHARMSFVQQYHHHHHHHRIFVLAMFLFIFLTFSVEQCTYESTSYSCRIVFLIFVFVLIQTFDILSNHISKPDPLINKAI